MRKQYQFRSTPPPVAAPLAHKMCFGTNEPSHLAENTTNLTVQPLPVSPPFPPKNTLFYPRFHPFFTPLEPIDHTHPVHPTEISDTIWLMRRIPIFPVLLLAASALLAQNPAPAPVTPTATINRYCLTCHSAQAKAGGLSLATLSPDNVAANPETWEKVVRKMRVRYMPPAGAPHPDEATYNSTIAALETALNKAASAKPDPGRTDTFRRLTRTEYHNAVRDLLTIDLDVSSLLPKDESSHGFDNITVGELSPSLLERYLSAATRISRLAVGDAPRTPGGDILVTPADLTQENLLTNLPRGTRGGAVFHYNFPVDGEYLVQLRLTRDRNERIEGLTEKHQVELMMDGERLQLFAISQPAKPTDHETADRELALRIPIKAGPHDLTATFLKKSDALAETERQPYQARFNMDRHPRIQPAIYSIGVTGPFTKTSAGDSPARRRIFSCHPATPAENDACAKRILLEQTRRAWRRPVTEAEIQPLLRFYREGAGQGFDNGIEMALRALLTSPNFLFRIERDPAGLAAKTPYKISDIDLAGRLSFFLWSSIPDDQLLAAAEQKRLHTPSELEAQTRRMLADPKARALITNFAGQWLYLRNLEAFTPDVRAYTDFDDNLRQALRQETELFVESIFKGDRNVADLLTARYTFLNERLAKHYGIPSVYGANFRRVDFPAESPRGGLLGQGSILSVTSYGNRTSPVLRGKWILANLLGTPPPPPPPNVPPLKDTASAPKPLSMRERMAEHRKNPACSGCHKLMDPAGLALENFDAIGRWRATDHGATIDSTGGLPGMADFQGINGLRTAMASRPELFVTTLTEKLMTYALGRGVETADAPTVRAIVAKSKLTDYRFSSLILGVVQSTPFEMRRTQ